MKTALKTTLEKPSNHFQTVSEGGFSETWLPSLKVLGNSEAFRGQEKSRGLIQPLAQGS
jgi:hypothetical protein